MAASFARLAVVALGLLCVHDAAATSLGRRLSARAITFEDNDPSLKPAASDLEIVPAGTILHEAKPMTAASTSGTAPTSSSSGVKYVTPLLSDQDHSKDRGYFEELVKYKDQLEEIQERKKETLKTAVVAAHYKIQQELYKRDEVLRKMEVLSLAINEQLERFARLEEQFHETDDAATKLQDHVEDIMQEYKADEEADADLVRSLEDQSDLLKQHQNEGKPPSIDALDKAASDCHEANFTEEGEEVSDDDDSDDASDFDSDDREASTRGAFEMAYGDSNRALRGIPDGRYDVVHPDQDCVKRSALFQLNTHLSREIATSAQLKSLIAFLSSTAQSTCTHDAKRSNHRHEAGCSHRMVEQHAKDYAKRSDLLQQMYKEFEELNKAMQNHKSSECHAHEFRHALDERMDKLELEVKAGFKGLSHKTDSAVKDIHDSVQDLSTTVSGISSSNDKLQTSLDEKIATLVDALSSPTTGDTAARVQDFSTRLQTLAAKLAQQVLGGEQNAGIGRTTPSPVDSADDNFGDDDGNGGDDDYDDDFDDDSLNADGDDDALGVSTATPKAKVPRAVRQTSVSPDSDDEFAAITTEALEETTPSDTSTAAKLRFARRRLSDTMSKSYHNVDKRRRSHH